MPRSFSSLLPALLALALTACGSGSTCSPNSTTPQCGPCGFCASTGVCVAIQNCGGDGQLMDVSQGDAAGTDALPLNCPAVVALTLNEVLYDDSGTLAFVEIKGPPGTDLTCYQLNAINGSNCESYSTTRLSGTIGSSGLFVVAESSEVMTNPDLIDKDIDLQNGADGLRIEYLGTPAPSPVDALFYGEDINACDMGEGSPAEDVSQGTSLSRCPDGTDGGDNASDFAATPTPTPGQPNACPVPCTAPADLVLNEVFYDTPESNDGGAFIEIKGPPGTALGCYELAGINGTGCSESVIELNGTIPADGYFVVAKDASVPTGDLVSSRADLQNGPDGVLLRFKPDEGAPVVIDGVFYGTNAEACAGFEGDPAPDVRDESLSRCADGSDTGNNALDFIATAVPTPGAPNQCPTVLPGECKQVSPFLINEVQTDPPGFAFVELAGPAGTDLGCYRLIPYDATCVAGTPIKLSGTAAPDGYTDLLDTLNPGIASSSTAGGFQLVYEHDELGTVPVDAVFFGGTAPAMACAALEGSVAQNLPSGQSLARCPDKSDTDDNGADFRLSTARTPGATNDCTVVKVCPAEPAALVINELFYDTGSAGDPGAFIEIKGPPGAELDCYQLIEVNGNGCKEESVIQLSGTVGASGYYLVARDATVAGADLVDTGADLQDGPDGVKLVFDRGAGAGPVLVDQVFYGDPAGCGAVEGTAAIDVGPGQVLARCADGADTDDNAKDLRGLATPTPGAANACPAPCVGPPAAVVINELFYDTGSSGDPGAFIELAGAPGQELRCYELLAINGAGCATYNSLPLDGFLSASGTYVIARDDSVAGADRVDSIADLQDGPDGLRLIFRDDVQGELPVDAVFYGTDSGGCGTAEGTPAPDVSGGQVLQRCPDKSDTGDNSVDFSAGTTPSPGTANLCGAPGGG